MVVVYIYTCSHIDMSCARLSLYVLYLRFLVALSYSDIFRWNRPRAFGHQQIDVFMNMPCKDGSHCCLEVSNHFRFQCSFGPSGDT